MSKLLTLLILLITVQLSAQTDWNDVMTQDNIRNFVGHLHGAGGDINQCVDVNDSNYHLLSLAIKTGATELQNHLLVQESLDLTTICKDKTILMYAVQYGDINIVKALINAGANLNQKTNEGKTALDFAKKYEKTDIYGFLKTQ